MPYINIDTGKGIIAHGTAPLKAKGPSEQGRAKVEVWAKGIEPVRENKHEYKGQTLYRMEPGTIKSYKMGHLVYSGSVKFPENNPFNDSATFTPDGLEAFRVWGAKPNVTVVKDGEVIARNVQSYDSRPLWQRPAVQKIGLALGAATAVGLVTTQTDVL